MDECALAWATTARGVSPERAYPCFEPYLNYPEGMKTRHVSWRRIIFGGVVCLFLSARGAALASSHEPTQVRVLSYNIHHGEGGDGQLDLERIASVITAAHVDVVALQEVDQSTQRTGGVDQARELARLTGMQVFYGKAMDYQGGAYGQALLSRWPLDDTRVHRLPNPSAREPRIAVSAIVRPSQGRVFRIVGTHLDAGREDRDRWEQAGDLEHLFVDDPLPVILMGDFNARPDSRVMARLLGFWKDASVARPDFTVPAKTPTARIDYILLSPAHGWRVISTRVLPEPVASDHRPVWAELELPALGK